MIDGKTFNPTIVKKGAAKNAPVRDKSRAPVEKGKVIWFQPQISPWRFSTRGIEPKQRSHSRASLSFCARAMPW